MPQTNLSDFVFFSLVNNYMQHQIAEFQNGFLTRMVAWASGMALVLVTLWIIIQGYRTITGQSRDPMMATVTNMARVAVIVTIASGMGIFGNDIQTFFSTNLGGEINSVVSGHGGSAADNIDANLAYTQLALGAIDAVQVMPGDTETADKKARSELIAAFGVASPPMTAGAMLLLYQFTLAVFIGIGPLFILCLIFDQTKELFRKWLLFGIGTLFSLAMLNVVCTIALKLTLSVVTALWTANYINNLTGFGSEGLSSQAMEQGGIGLLMTVLIVSVPPIIGNFFAGAAGSFMHFSAFGGGASSRPGPQGQPAGSYAPPPAATGHVDPGRTSNSAFNNNAGRVAGNQAPAVVENIPQRNHEPKG